MFYQYDGSDFYESASVEYDQNRLTVAYVTSDELRQFYRQFGFAESTAAACQTTNMHFRSGVETYDDYTFTELRVIGDTPEMDDWIALYIKKNFLMIVDVLDADGSTRRKFEAALHRCAQNTPTLEKLIYAFLDQLISTDIAVIEDFGDQLTQLEDELLNNQVEREFNVDILATKKRLLRLHYYYEQILDITQSLEANENELFSTDRLMYIANLSRRVERLREDADSLKNTAEHLQDAYYSYLDTRMNQTMKYLTVLTTIFFPLTIIVGWYGMNFTTMPELTWRFGYLYVIVLSVLVVVLLALVGRRRRWFR